MTSKNSLLKIKKCLSDEEILDLHFEGCHTSMIRISQTALNQCNQICNECWLNAIKALE